MSFAVATSLRRRSPADARRPRARFVLPLVLEIAAMSDADLVETFYQALSRAGASGSAPVFAKYLDPDARFAVAHPINDLSGRDAIVEGFFAPLLRALPDLERKPFVIVSEQQGDGSFWVDSTGYFIGTFTEPLFDIPPSGRTLYLRYTELTKVQGDAITECYMIPDFIDAMEQVGVNPVRPSLGHPGLVMPPSTQDGLDNYDTEGGQGEASKKLVLDMLDCLGRFDGKSLASMDLENYWHPDFMWYGPGGIGTTRGISGFREHHQGPFVFAFPDRGVDHGVNIVASGNYVATGGWPHMSGTHTGEGWLGLAPTGTELTLRVMDIWRREGDLLKENWVAIDIIDMLMQMGIDVFAQMRERSR